MVTTQPSSRAGQQDVFSFIGDRTAPNFSFALVAMLGLLGMRIFEATSSDIADLG